MAKTINRTKEINPYDNFYTKYETIEEGLKTFLPFFKGKTIYCNCDDYRYSQFVVYFKNKFTEIGLSKLVATCFNKDGQGLKYVKTEKSTHTYRLKGNGDFRSEECKKFLSEKDVIVITNPPFSLKEDFICLMMNTGTPFLAILPQTTITIKKISKYVVKNQLWFGDGIENGGTEFLLSKEYPLTAKCSRIDEKGNRYAVLSGIKWFTNIDYQGRYKNDFKNTVRYKKTRYEKYDNMHGIDVPKLSEIPHHYYGIMGVPTTFLFYYNPHRYRIIGFRKGLDGKDLSVNGKEVFARYLIQRIKAV